MEIIPPGKGCLFCAVGVKPAGEGQCVQAGPRGEGPCLWKKLPALAPCPTCALHPVRTHPHIPHMSTCFSLYPTPPTCSSLCPTRTLHLLLHLPCPLCLHTHPVCPPCCPAHAQCHPTQALPQSHVCGDSSRNSCCCWGNAPSLAVVSSEGPDSSELGVWT